MLVERIRPGKIVDTSGVMTPKLVSTVKSAGFGGVVRYVPHVGAAGQHDITAQEAGIILGGGLGLLLVQHVRLTNWNPADCSGHDDGMAAASRAYGCGYLPGAHIFCDLEGMAGGAAAAQDYANSWADAVVAAGFLAGCYVGYQVPLSPQQLYQLHRMTSYWSDAATRQVAGRGFSMKQHFPITLGGLQFDPNDVAVDHRGETPAWVIG
jgi:hypothetical protein